MAQTQTQIATDAIAYITANTSQITNWNVGSVGRSFVDAFAAEASALDQQSQDRTKNAIVNVGYQLLGLSLPQATGSTYTLDFTLSSSASASVTVPAGTLVTIPNSNLQWETGQTINVAPGTTVTTTATCTTTGSATNVPIATITQLIVPIVGLTVTNPSAQPTVMGRDQPSQTAVQAIISQQINQLHVGNQNAVETGVLSASLTDASGNVTEQVIAVREVDITPSEQFPINGFVYIYNGVGAASTALIDLAQNIVNGYVYTSGVVHEGCKAAGVILQVVDAYQTPVDLSLAILPKYGYTLASVETNVAYAVNDYFASLDINSGFSVTQLAYQILAASGVADAQVLSPTASLPATPYVTTPSAPTLSAVSGGSSLSAGSYLVAVTFTTPFGETEASPTASITISTGQAIDASTSLAFGATGVNYYLSEPNGTTLYLVASTSSATQLITNDPVTTAAQPPTSSTATIQGNMYVLGNLSISQATS